MNSGLLAWITSQRPFRPFNTEPVRSVLSHHIKRRPAQATLVVLALLLLLVAAPAPQAQPKANNEAATLIAEARSLWQNGKQFEAIDKIKKAAVLEPGNAATHVELAGMYISVKSNDLARSAVTEALKADPNYAPSHQTMAALLRMAGDFEGAIREARLALTLKPDAATEASAHVTIGRALNRMNRNTEAAGEFDKAVQVYEAVTRKTPVHASAYEALGDLLLEIQRYSEAEAAYRRAVELKPQTLRHFSALAEPYTIRVRRKKPSNTIGSTFSSILRQPTNPTWRHKYNGWRQRRCQSCLVISCSTPRRMVIVPMPKCYWRRAPMLISVQIIRLL